MDLDAPIISGLRRNRPIHSGAATVNISAANRSLSAEVHEISQHLPVRRF